MKIRLKLITTEAISSVLSGQCGQQTVNAQRTKHGQKWETVTLLFIYSKALFE